MSWYDIMKTEHKVIRDVLTTVRQEREQKRLNEYGIGKTTLS